jgi:hypothetical protein
VIERVAVVLLALLVPLIQGRIDARRGRFQAQEEGLFVWSGPHVRSLSPGLENVLADIYWLRTVQYFGGTRAFATDKKFELLEPLINITTTLDPRFELAYRYGAIFLAEPLPNGAGQPKAAVALLAKGARENPESWRIRQDWGFVTFFFLHDAKEASRILEDASRLPGAPIWLHTSAADFLTKGGERETARKVWLHLFEQTEGNMRDNARFNLNRLDALDAVDAHQAAVKEFEQRFGRLPASLGELGPAGLLRAPLVDVSRVPYDYDPRTGTVSIGHTSYLWRRS